ncbi:MAG TPA: FAD-binding oxidoreductase [Burkholderiaceae bacterium]|jgi:ferredoxin-NADP reductase|nr:FAD-binding oxidoreductase [Burkholderiaceae bacterium]
MDAASAAPLRWQQAVIERIVPRTARVVSVFLRAALGPHQAGQHVDIRLTAPDGYQAQRSYSIGSAPGAPQIELAIERLDDGEVSPYFHEVARPGDTFEVRGPIGGHFIWRAEDGGPLLLVAGGSGVVPLMAMARHRDAVAPQTVALLVYSARTWDELVYRDELLSAQALEANFDLVFVTTRQARHRPGDLDRRLDRTLLRDILARWRQRPRHTYVCGSSGFVEAVTGALVLEGVAAASIRAERYGEQTER